MSQWWKEKVIYEVLVHSFQDSDGDGIGDLKGLIQRLDYLVDLGVGALWLSPINRSEFFDVGYDVSDYRSIDPRFGTMDDFNRLVDEVHRRDLRLVLDYVPNHTSNYHPWFMQSRASRDNPYRNYYLWSDPAADGGAPNNWINRFGLSAWTFDHATGQYYFGTFAPEQPDLNWRNPDVRREMLDVLRFWFNLGCDGVRVDALSHLIKDERFRRNPPDPDYTEDSEPSNRVLRWYSQNQPELLDLIHEMKQVVSEFPGRLLMGEAFQSAEQLATYQRFGADLLLNTSMLQGRFTQDKLQDTIDRVEATTPRGAWPSHASGDHDLIRLASRLQQHQLRPAALLQFTVRGATTMYYGEELGLEDAYIPPEAMVDPSGRSDPRYGRDSRRVPMPWNGEPNVGFTTGKPWLPIDEPTRKKNVESQRHNPNSLLNFYKRLLKLRASQSELQTGDYTPLDSPPNVIAFRRGDPRTGLLIALNFSDQTVSWQFNGESAEVLLSTCDLGQRRSENELKLAPHEGVIVRIRPNQ